MMMIVVESLCVCVANCAMALGRVFRSIMWAFPLPTHWVVKAWPKDPTFMSLLFVVVNIEYFSHSQVSLLFGSYCHGRVCGLRVGVFVWLVL